MTIREEINTGTTDITSHRLLIVEIYGKLNIDALCKPFFCSIHSLLLVGVTYKGYNQTMKQLYFRALNAGRFWH